MRTTIAALFALAACTTEPTTGTTVAQSQSKWDDALPALQAACTACHGNSANLSGLDFLAGNTAEEIRLTLLASGVINFENPYASRILTKGLHEGPYFTATELDALLKWIESEVD